MYQRKRKREWTDLEVSRLKRFVKESKIDILNQFYRNLVDGYCSQRRKKGFFENMSQFVKRPSTDCKSKFQKMEEKLYLRTLEIPKNHFLAFKNKNKTKQIQKSKNIFFKLQITQFFNFFRKKILHSLC